ncbi:hypothetical protein [Actinoplanes couchii]|uniref:Protein kinase domain-containing protein n=1 Tax=Actinoplanes couchii TaxID=403638 RepID=A0ABQ3XKE0_9ACTN|nr:hypothetical protein [Actinoplanes couchii]MDR6320558.1 hypothetical protein [Actinoplanes couchii]GID58960.1 hypothetical protein Aco03nite_073640 [Actinoplanes couchii]
MKPIRADRLGTLTPLGKGGMAQVYRVGNPLPEFPNETLAFKKLLPSIVEPNRTKLLTAMRTAVGLRDLLGPAEQAELDAVAVWPLAMVQEGGGDVGLLMRCIPDDFFLDTRNGREVFELQLLCTSTKQATAMGYDKSRERADKPLVRLALAARLAYAMEVVHRPRGGQRLVYGDMNLKNVAVATDPPRVLLMDCDGVADVGDTSRTQPNTFLFFPPEIIGKQQKLQDQVTDVYKLALAIMRGLSTGQAATQVKDPASPKIISGLLDPAGVALFRSAVDSDRARRPAAEDLKEYLVDRVLDLASPPVLLSAELSDEITLRGSEVFVRWTHQGARTVRIHSAVGNFSVDGIAADGYPGGYPIKPPTAGEIRVTAVNDDGEDTMSAGRLRYFEIPDVHVSLHPPPVVLDGLPSMELPRTHAELPPYPMHSAEVVAVPPVRWPQVPPLRVAALGSPAPLARDLWQGIGRAYHDASERIDLAIRAAVDDATRTLPAPPPAGPPTP